MMVKDSIYKIQTHREREREISYRRFVPSIMYASFDEKFLDHGRGRTCVSFLLPLVDADVIDGPDVYRGRAGA